MAGENGADARVFPQPTQVGLDGEALLPEHGSPGILLIPAQVVLGVVSGHQHEGGQPDGLGAGLFKLFQNGGHPPRSFHGGEKRQAVAVVQLAGEVGKHHVAASFLLAVPHEQDGFILLPFRGEMLQKGRDGLVPVPFAFQQGAADEHVVKAVRMARQETDDLPLHPGKLLAGGDVKGLDAQCAYAFAGHLFQIFLHGGNGGSASGKLLADNA